MKHLLLFLFSLCSLFAYSQEAVKVKVTKPGTLSTLLTKAQQDTCQHLVVSGKLNSADIQGDIELMGNSRVKVETGGKLIIDGGTLSNVNLVLKTGAYLQIINDGVLETRNGFNAPVGAIVNIENGKIL